MRFGKYYLIVRILTKYDNIMRHTFAWIEEGVNFPREKHQSILVVAMSAVTLSLFSTRVGLAGCPHAAVAADDGRTPPLFATEPTRFHTENRTRGALIFEGFKNPKPTSAITEVSKFIRKGMFDCIKQFHFISLFLFLISNKCRFQDTKKSARVVVSRKCF